MPIRQVVFTSSGQYVPSSGMVTCVVELCGGGAAGAGVAGAAGEGITGGGGGSGAYTRMVFTRQEIGAGQNVVIGNGGVGIAGNVNAPGGGTTTFGNAPLLSAPGAPPLGGGGGGQGAPAMSNPPIGALALPGADGSTGIEVETNWVAGGTGAGSYFGGDSVGPPAGPGLIVSGAQGVFGAGGSGAAANNNTAATPGGNGGNGICVILEYVSANAPPMPPPHPKTFELEATGTVTN